MRQTSLAAYLAIQKSGVLSRCRWQVYDYLFHHGPLTSAQVDAQLRGGEVRPSFGKRLPELESLGVVYRVRIGTCPITGNQSYVWGVTDFIPEEGAKLPRPTSRAELLEELARLRSRVEQLEQGASA